MNKIKGILCIITVGLGLTSCNNLYGFPSMEEIRDSTASYNKLVLNESNYLTPDVEISKGYMRNIDKAREQVVNVLNSRYEDANFASKPSKNYSEILVNTFKYPFEYVTTIYREYTDGTYSVLDNYDLISTYKDEMNKHNKDLIGKVYKGAEVFTFLKTRAKILTNTERTFENLNKGNLYVNIVLIPESENDMSKIDSNLKRLKEICLESGSASYFKLYYLSDREIERYREGMTLKLLEGQYVDSKLDLKYYTLANILKIEYNSNEDELKYSEPGTWYVSPNGVAER